MENSKDSPEQVSLEAVNTLTLNDLMNKDPAELTREEENIIISEFRKGRAQWADEDRAAKTQGRRAKTSKGIKDLSKVQVDLSDLDVSVD